MSLAQVFIAESRVGDYSNTLNFPKKLFKTPSFVLLHGNLGSHSVWNGSRLIGGNSHTSDLIFVLCEGNRLGSRLCLVLCKQAVSSESLAVPSAESPSSLLSLLFSLKTQGINWIECVHQFYAIFSNFFQPVLGLFSIVYVSLLLSLT